MNTIDLLKDKLRRASYSKTRSRMVVFNAIEQSQPLTMTQLINDINGKIDRASIYRTVKLFEELTIIKRLQIGWKYRIELSDEFQEHHHHMLCMECGTIINFKESPELENALKQIALSANSIMLSHSLELAVICSRCKLETPANTARV